MVFLGLAQLIALRMGWNGPTRLSSSPHSSLGRGERKKKIFRRLRWGPLAPENPKIESEWELAPLVNKAVWPDE